MGSSRRLIVAAAAIVCGLWSSAVIAQPRALREWRELITCVPRTAMLDTVEPQVRERFPSLLRLSDADTRALLSSTDPRDKGIGLFILDQRGDVRGLLDCSELLTDQRPTVPMAVISAAHGQYLKAPQTVEGYYRALCEVWFGATAVQTDALRDQLAAIEDPDQLAQPWRIRLMRAFYSGRERGDWNEFDAVRARVRSLPPDTRLVAILVS